MDAEIFVLYRNGERYTISVSREHLMDITENNPDFTEPQDGKMPTYQIVRYVPAILGKAAQSEYLTAQ